jgi:hypothetical protein
MALQKFKATGSETHNNTNKQNADTPVNTWRSLKVERQITGKPATKLRRDEPHAQNHFRMTT